MITLWHNPRCSKSRQALALREEAGAEVTVRRYLEDAPTSTEIEAVRKAMGYERISLFGNSYGTRLQMLYQWQHSASIHRNVICYITVYQSKHATNGIDVCGFQWLPDTSGNDLNGGGVLECLIKCCLFHNCVNDAVLS